MIDYRTNRNNNNNTNGGLFSEICPSINNYMIYNLNTMTKIINHILILLLFCNVMLWFNCSIKGANNSNSIEKVSMGYNISFISFLLLSQTIVLLIIINNTNNKYSILSLFSYYCIPSYYTIGICIGLCIGSTIISYILSTSFYTALQQCTAFDKLLTASTTTTNINNHNIRVLQETIISNITTIPQQESSQQQSTNTNTNTFTNDNNTDLLLDYICSKVFQKLINTRYFWSKWIFRLNFINCFLIAVAHTELVSNNNNGTNSSQQQGSYSGVATYDDYSNNNNINNQQQQQQQQNGLGGNSNSSSAVVSPLSYNNNSSMASVGNIFNSVASHMPTVAAIPFVGNYATVPEVRTGNGATGTPSSSSSIASSSKRTTSGNGSGGETANILSV